VIKLIIYNFCKYQIKRMKTIIAGSRAIKDYDVVAKAITESNFLITEVVSGGAAGVDVLGERYARENNIGVKRFIPDWSKGKSAGFVRNAEMGQYADQLIAIWDGESKGTARMIKYATSKKLKIYVYRVEN
jgi:hypothetical protein